MSVDAAYALETFQQDCTLGPWVGCVSSLVYYGDCQGMPLETHFLPPFWYLCPAFFRILIRLLWLVVNVPEEVAHYLEEMKFKDVKLNALRRRIQHYDNSIQKHIRQHGSLSENPKEAINNPKIVTDYEQAIKLQNDKYELAHKLDGLVCLASLDGIFADMPYILSDR